MYSLYLNNTGFEMFCNFKDSLRRSQNKEISFPFSVGSSPDPSTENLIVRIFLWFWGPSWRGREARTVSPRAPMRTQKYKVTTRSARCGYGLSSKWVRVKASAASPNTKTRVIALVLLYLVDLTGNRKPEQGVPFGAARRGREHLVFLSPFRAWKILSDS